MRGREVGKVSESDGKEMRENVGKGDDKKWRIIVLSDEK